MCVRQNAVSNGAHCLEMGPCTSWHPCTKLCLKLLVPIKNKLLVSIKNKLLVPKVLHFNVKEF